MRGIHWFRNDLRLHDNLALTALAGQVQEWLPIFVIDSELDQRTGPAMPRVRFLFDCLSQLEADLAKRGIELRILKGLPEEVIPEWMERTNATLVTWNNASTPWGRRRDDRVKMAVARAGRRSMGVDDHTVFGADEINSTNEESIAGSLNISLAWIRMSRSVTAPSRVVNTTFWSDSIR